MLFLFGFASLPLSEAVLGDQRLAAPVHSSAPEALDAGRCRAC